MKLHWHCEPSSKPPALTRRPARSARPVRTQRFAWQSARTRADRISFDAARWSFFDCISAPVLRGLLILRRSVPSGTCHRAVSCWISLATSLHLTVSNYSVLQCRCSSCKTITLDHGTICLHRTKKYYHGLYRTAFARATLRTHLLCEKPSNI